MGIIGEREQPLTQNQLEEKRRLLIKQIITDFSNQFPEVNPDAKIWFSNELQDHTISQLQRAVDKEPVKKANYLASYHTIYINKEEKIKNMDSTFASYIVDPAPEAEFESSDLKFDVENLESYDLDLKDLINKCEDSIKNKITIHKPTGLRNVKNCCYFNSMIQTLFHIPRFTQTI